MKKSKKVWANFQAERDLILSTSKRKVKVEPSSNAQTNKLCELGETLAMDYSWAIDIAEKLGAMNKELKYMFLFQYSCSLRISEVLSIKYENITISGDVKIEGAKGSKQRIVSGGEASLWLIQAKKDKRNPFSTFNRFFVYRAYKKLGINFQSSNSVKSSVTHSIRHAKAKLARENNFSNEDISQILNHSNPKNQSYYGKDGQK